MEPHDSSGEAPRTGVATNRVDAVVAFILLMLGIVVIIESRRLGSGWTSDGPGAGYFPFWIGVILAISGAGVFYDAMLGKKKNTEVFVDREQFKLVLSVLVPAIVYVGAVQVLGIYIASAIYIALFMVVLGKYSWVKSVIAGVGVNVFFYCMFEIWFKVPLYKGALDPLHFLQ